MNCLLESYWGKYWRPLVRPLIVQHSVERPLATFSVPCLGLVGSLCMLGEQCMLSLENLYFTSDGDRHRLPSVILH